MSRHKMVIAVALSGMLCVEELAFAQQTPKQAAPVTSAPVATKVQSTTPSIRRTETIAIEGWTVTCREVEGAKRACSAELRVLQQDANNQPRVIFNWVLGLNEGKPLTFLQVPTGVLIQPGIEIKIASKDIRKVPYTLCDQVKCEAVVAMDEAFIKDISAAAITDIIIQAVDGRSLTFGMNTKGFDRALAEIRR
jgi:invasion protein IalB